MVNTATSDLSSVSPAKDGAPFDKQPFIVKLLKDMFKQRPSLPCYRMTYDVAKVSQYISNSYSKMSLECQSVDFKWTKIPNYEHIKYQLYAYRCIFNY